MKKTQEEKRVTRIRIIIDLVILTVAVVLAYEFIAKDFLKDRGIVPYYQTNSQSELDSV